MATAPTSASAGPRHYAWWFPGSPIRVHIDLSVIEGLQAQLQDAGSGKTEHGLLFGRVLEGATEILEFQPALNRSVPEMIADFAATRGKRLLVGYYRTSDALRLNENDLALFKTFFAKPYQVFLLAQPNGFGPPNASFFFSRGDQKMSEFPFLEFPLDAGLLATEQRDRLSRCQQATEKPEQPVAAPQPLPPQQGKPGKRHRIFPGIAAGVIVVATSLLAALWITYPSLRERASRTSSAILSPIRGPQPVAQPSLPSTPHPRLGLQARRQERDLELTWDRESPAIAAATSGLISIEDGSLKRQISLDAQQLRGESILYSPKFGQILIQLAVTTPTGVVTESFRIIRPEEIPNYSASNSPDRPVRFREAAPEPTIERIPAVKASKPFSAPPAEKKTSALVSLNEPPALSSNPDRPASPVPFVAGQIVAPPPPKPNSIPTPATMPPASTPPPAAAPAYHPPVPLSQVMPQFPGELRSLAFKPIVVSIKVAIDRNGKVVKAEPLPQESAHKLFITNAVRAAQAWKFQPARRGDEPVASESVLRFTFSK